MSENLDQRFAPPQAQVADLATDEAVLAGRGGRLLAAIVDGLLIAAVVWVAGKVPALQFLTQTAPEANGLTSNPLSLLFGFCVFLLIQSGLLLTRGQTVGKALLKMRIVRTDGSKPEAWRLLGLRYGIGFLANLNVYVSGIYGLVDCLLIFRESRQCLHDSIADTKVIQL